MNAILDALIIGGGPAGLMTALAAADAGCAAIAVLEKMPAPGRKLLASGSSRCNLTHAGGMDDFLTHYGDASRFVKPCLLSYTNAMLCDFFTTRGVPLTERENGKIFPSSERSADILRALLDACRERGIIIHTNAPARDIVPDENGFAVHGAAQTFSARSVCIATGGITYPATGSTGDGYALARQPGLVARDLAARPCVPRHTIIDPAPALTPVEVDKYPCAHLAGIALRCGFALLRNGRKAHAYEGDILFTHTGLSGPGILDASRYMLPGDTITLNAAGFDDEAACDADLAARFAAQGKRTAKSIITHYGLPERLCLHLLAHSAIAPDALCATIDRAKRKSLARALTALPFIIASLGDERIAMVTRGGVNRAEVNPKTMESRLTPGLFFAGEVLDVDGDTGGYNLQFAFSSGFMAGKSIARRRHAS